MTSPTRVRRSLATLAAAASLALFGALGAGCLEQPDPADEVGAFYAGLPEVDCGGLQEWAQSTVYPIGAKVTDTGDVFSARYSHTAFAPNWNPKNAGSI
ncbi:MAG TPA: carbohydrate-binding protein, partial [Kofleriaceae bacterium]|nr:carbohydrate-binding protein [Kofleriaceae bacterium]